MSPSDENSFRYVPIRPRDVQWGLYVTGAGQSSIHPGQPYPSQPHPELYHFSWEAGRVLPEYQAIYITRGQGHFDSSPTGPISIAPGTVILLFPGVWHRYRPQPEIGWDECWVSFNGAIMDRLVANKFFAPEHAVINTGVQQAIRTPFQSLLDRLRGEQTGFPHLIAATTLEILAAISAAAERQPTELIVQGPQDVSVVRDRIVAETMRLIWQQSHGPMTVDSLARQLPITRRSLERRFQAAIGHGIYDEIVRCRLERAKRLLIGTHLSLKEVAAAAGFTGADAMGRVFRRLEGQTPVEFRQQNADES